MMSDASAAAAHAANIQTSETLRQQDVFFVTVLHAGRPPVGAAPSPLQIGTTAAHIAHLRRCLNSAIANGASPSTYLMALRSLGASMYS
jgi:hypothetical protein